MQFNWTFVLILISAYFVLLYYVGVELGGSGAALPAPKTNSGPDIKLKICS